VIRYILNSFTPYCENLVGRVKMYVAKVFVNTRDAHNDALIKKRLFFM
jgi:hypothetical protein